MCCVDVCNTLVGMCIRGKVMRIKGAPSAPVDSSIYIYIYIYIFQEAHASPPTRFCVGGIVYEYDVERMLCIFLALSVWTEGISLSSQLNF